MVIVNHNSASVFDDYDEWDYNCNRIIFVTVTVIVVAIVIVFIFVVTVIIIMKIIMVITQVSATSSTDLAMVLDITQSSIWSNDR